MIRCEYCRANNKEPEQGNLVVCEYCGRTFGFPSFYEADAKRQAAEARSAALAQELQDITFARENAEKKLLGTISHLESIDFSQQDSANKLAKLLEEQLSQSNQLEDVQETQQNITAMLRALQDAQLASGDRQNVLLQTAAVLMSGQDTAQGKLDSLIHMTEVLTSTQKNGMQKAIELSQALSSLKADVSALAGSLFARCSALHDAEITHLEQLGDSAKKLSSGQAVIREKIAELNTQSSRIQDTLDAFVSRCDREKAAKLKKLFEQATDHQISHHFGKALELYDKIIQEGAENDAEICWREVECFYGIEYEKKGEREFVPTMFMPVLDDPQNVPARRALDRALQEGTDETVQHYRSSLAELDAILDQYRKFKYTRPYDVFISVKHSRSDKKDAFTRDSDIAGELYSQLREWGLSVFNSRMEFIPAGSEFEPFIISALNTAKVMIVVGTSRENMEAKWVKNEWVRFQFRIQDAQKNGKPVPHLFCYLGEGMTADRVPPALDPGKQMIYHSSKAKEHLRTTLAQIFPDNPDLNPRKEPEHHEEDISPKELENKFKTWVCLGHFDKIEEALTQLKRFELLTHMSVIYYACARQQIKFYKKLIYSDQDLSENEDIQAMMDLILPQEQQKLEALLLENRIYRRSQPKAQKKPLPHTEKPPAPLPPKEDMAYAMAAVQKDDLRSTSLFSHENGAVFGNFSIQRKDILAIQFKPTLSGAPIDAWDISEAKNRSVLAWAASDCLTVAANGFIQLPKDSSSLFAGFRNVKSIDFGNTVTTAGVENMSLMFYKCSSLETLDLSGFDTAEVTAMASMFHGCESLKSLEVAGFDTAKATDMRGMFQMCESLKSLDLSGFHTAHVTDMCFMFNWCTALALLDISGFDTSSVTDMSYMFAHCGALEILDLSHFHTAKVTNMSNMFESCISLRLLDLSNFQTAEVTDMSSMFSFCSALAALDISGFDTSRVTNMAEMFFGCPDQNKYHTPRKMSGSRGAAALSPQKDGSKETAAMSPQKGAFRVMAAVQKADLHGKTLSHETGAVFGNSSMQRRDILSIQFKRTLGEAPIGAWDVSEAKDRSVLAWVTQGCLTVAANGFIQLPKDSSFLFSGFENVRSIDFGNTVITSGVEKMSSMFYQCSALDTLDLSGFDTAKVTSLNSMFAGCRSLKALDLSSFRTANVTDMGYMFCQCIELASLDISGFDTSGVTSMSFMFSDCDALKTLDISHFNTQNVKNLLGIFLGCPHRHKYRIPKSLRSS